MVGYILETKSGLEGRGSPSVSPGPAVSATPGKLFKTNIPTTDLVTQKLLCVRGCG